KTSAIEERMARVRRALSPYLGSGTASSSLRAIITQARSLVDKADRLQRDAQKLTGELEQGEAERKVAEEALAKWRTEWREAMNELGRNEATSAGEANEFIADCAEMQKMLGEADRVRSRMEAILADAAAFEKEASALFTQLLPG